jgi:hypothetical protein
MHVVRTENVGLTARKSRFVCVVENKTLFRDFYFGALRPVARALSRPLEELSLATTLQGVYLYLFRRYMFRPSLAIFRRNTQLVSGSYLTTTDPLFLSCMCYFEYGLANTARRQYSPNLKP